MTLEDRLERLANRTPLGDASDVLDAARIRAEARPESRRPRVLAAAAAVLAIVALAAGGLALIGGDDSDSVTVAGPNESLSADDLDGLWRVVSTVDDGERQPAAGTATLRFDGDRVQGDDGCNNHIDTVFANGVIVPPEEHTQVGCLGFRLTQEADRLWMLLGEPVELRDGELWIVADDGDGLVFARAEEREEAPAEGDPSVTVALDGFGPIEASVSPLLASAQAASTEGWLEHTVTFQNTGEQSIHLQDFRSGAMLGDREVAVATDGCGYGASGDQPVAMGCRYDYRPVTIQPGGTHTFTITLWRDLAGMNPVGEGTYEWSWSVDRRDTPFDDPDQTGTTGTVILTYEDLGSTSGSTGPDQAGTDAAGGVDGPVLYGPETHLDRAELAKLTGVLGLEDGCLYLQPPPNVRDPLQEPLVWPYGTTWQNDPPGVRLADSRFLPLGGLFTAAGGMHSADRLIDLGHAPTVAERAQNCARGDISEIAYIQGEVTIIDSGASAGVSAADAETIVSAFLDLANQPSPDAAERLPFADQVQLGLGRDLHQTRSAAELADPSAWIIDEEYFRAATGPFSALDKAAGSQDTVVTVGEHTHCASPPVPPPGDVAALARISVQPDPERIDSCLQWWTVDFFVNATGNIEAVTLDFWEP